jgi:hypothetical protein
MERLVLLRIAADSVDTRAGCEEDGDSHGRPEGRRKMQRCPAIGREGLDERGILLEQDGKTRFVADGRCFKNVGGNSIGRQAREQKVPNQLLAAVDGPE